jgi:hypothetical protein
VHVIGHFDFVESLLEGLSASKRATARRALERYELLASPWSQVVGELAKLGLSRKALDDLAAMDVCGAYHLLAKFDRPMLILHADEEQIVDETLAKLSFAASPKFRRAVQEVKQVR